MYNRSATTSTLEKGWKLHITHNCRVTTGSYIYTHIHVLWKFKLQPIPDLWDHITVALKYN